MGLHSLRPESAMFTPETLLTACDLLIRQGQLHEAARQLSALDSQDLPRKTRAPLAALCRRAGLTSLGLKILGPLVHTNTRKYIGPALPEELAEYAALLERKGAVKEALFILSEVDARQTPIAFFHKANCHFALWEPDLAAEALEAYLQCQLDEYPRFMGQVHLAQALVMQEKFEAALPMITQNISEASTKGYSRLLVTCLHMRAQLYVTCAKYPLALEDLEAARHISSGDDGLDILIGDKWQAVIRAMVTKDIQPLLTFREQALHAGHWESVREADLYCLKIQFDPMRLDHLLFGTPFEAYREHVRHELKQGPSSSNYVFGTKTGPQIDVFESKQNDEKIKPTAKIRALLAVLLRDFYRPFGVGGIFAGVFPEERFHFATSPHRVHQLVYRARTWIQEVGLPIEIYEANGKFSLRLTGECGFMLPYESKPQSKCLSLLADLHRHFGIEATFSAQQARKALGFTLTSFNRLLGSSSPAIIYLRSARVRRPDMF